MATFLGNGRVEFQTSTHPSQKVIALHYADKITICYNEIKDRDRKKKSCSKIS